MYTHFKLKTTIYFVKFIRPRFYFIIRLICVRVSVCILLKRARTAHIFHSPDCIWNPKTKA